MADLSTGSDHPPPDGVVKPGRITMTIRTIMGVPFSIGALLTGAQDNIKIDPPLLGPIRAKVQENLGREIPPLPRRSPEGSAWKIGSLAKHICELLNTHEKGI